MALIAFDGTWNRDESDIVQDTNVARFGAAYRGKVSYIPGVGTRRGRIGKVVGGLLGVGGEDRIDEGIAATKRHLAEGDTNLDVVGFSRGAAIALDFCNELRDELPQARVRFLGLFDVVASFGVPGNSFDPGKDLTLSDNVARCYHAMAIDERRGNFPVTRIKPKKGQEALAQRVFEVWFRGVHSDVGGGNGKAGLSSIALCWFFARARACGLEFDPVEVAQWQGRRQPDEPLYANKDLLPDPFRRLYPTDVVHDSLRVRPAPPHQNPLPTMRVVGDDGTYRVAAFGAGE
ncbi:MAG: DUF2235 domain-containing protein [Planctomycetes bacterium]|nr:DUF2235 domain-containing protein [Planctomycetota bacterium]